MFKKIFCVSLLTMASFSAFAVNSTDALQARNVGKPIAALSGKVDVTNLQFCADQVKKSCDPRQDFSKWGTCVQNIMDSNKDKCTQANAIYNSQKLFYDAAQAAGPVTIFTIVSVGDGATTYYMIDHSGRIISLVSEQDEVIKHNPQFLTLQKQNPNTMIMDVEAPKGVAVPTVVMPKAEQKNIKIIFPQTIKTCRACSTLATAKVAYLFDKEGNYLEAKVLKIKKS